MTVSDAVVQQIKSLIAEEIDVYTQYMLILSEERSSIVSYKLQEINDLTKRRNVLVNRMENLHKRRLQIISKFPDNEGKNLTQLVRKHIRPADAKKILSEIRKLKKLVTKTRRRSIEFGRVTSFASNVVNGVLSLMYQASQNVVKSYSRKGTVKESYNPNDGSRSNAVRKKA